MGNAFGAGLDNEAPRGRDVTERDRRIEESHTMNRSSPIQLLRDDLTNLSEEFAFSTPHDVTAVVRRRCSIL